MATLHVIATSPSTSKLYDLCAAVSQGDALLFIEDGVYFAQDLHSLSPLPTQQYFFLGEDAAARGISAPDRYVDYIGFVDLTAQYERSLSWF